MCMTATGPEKNRFMQKRTVRGLWNYTTCARTPPTNHAEARNICRRVIRIFLSLYQNRVGVKSVLGETVLGEEPL